MGVHYKTHLPTFPPTHQNFLYMLDAGARPDYRPNPRLACALDILFLLHAEHELNCSTSAARHLASSGALRLHMRARVRVRGVFGLCKKREGGAWALELRVPAFAAPELSLAASPQGWMCTRCARARWARSTAPCTAAPTRRYVHAGSRARSSPVALALHACCRAWG